MAEYRVEPFPERLRVRRRHNLTFEVSGPKGENGYEVEVHEYYNGMGFMLIKKGVFEKVKYPWFCQLKKQIGDLEDYCSEDVAFCHLAKEAGFKIYVDPEIIVGHEKMRILT